MLPGCWDHVHRVCSGISDCIYEQEKEAEEEVLETRWEEGMIAIKLIANVETEY